MPPALAAALAGGALAGLGGGIGGALQSKAAKEAAQTQAMGPVRGGTQRAGNADTLKLTENPQIMSQLGKTLLPIRTPAYGNPIDFNSLYTPQQFGTGFSVGNKNGI